MDRGVLDAAEFNNPSSDLALGFPDVSKVYMVQSFHQDMECFEIIFNKAKYNALPKELQAILRYSAEAASADMSWKWQKRYPEDLVKIEKMGVKVYETPTSVLQGAARGVGQGPGAAVAGEQVLRPRSSIRRRRGPRRSSATGPSSNRRASSRRSTSSV